MCVQKYSDNSKYGIVLSSVNLATTTNYLLTLSLEIIVSKVSEYLWQFDV